MKSEKFYLIFVVMIAAMLVCASCPPPAPPQVTLCHATPPDTAAQGWNLLTIAAPAVLQQGHDGHGADIIPAFEWYENEVVGTQLQHRYKYWGHWGPWYNGACNPHYWWRQCQEQTINIYDDVLHSYPGKNLTTIFGWGATGQEVLENSCVMPTEPHQYTVNSHQSSDCDGYSRLISLYDFGIFQETLYSDQGSWVDIYTLEEVPAMTFDVPAEYGEDINFSTLAEPAECLITRTYKAHQAATCEGVHRVINLYEGPNGDPYQTLVGTHYNKMFPFVDIYVLETIPAVTIDVPAEYGPDYTFTAKDEPVDCLITLEHQYTIGEDSDCDGWVINPTVSGGGTFVTPVLSGVWSEPYTLETFTGTIDFSWPDGHSETFTLEIEEPADCLIVLEHGAAVGSNSNCTGWSVSFADDEGGEITSAIPGTQGSWNMSYRQESQVVTVVVTWPDEHSKTFTLEINEPARCVELEPVTTRPLWLLVGADGRLCLLFSDTHPSVGRQNTLCFPCDDPDWQAINVPCVDYIYDDGTEFGHWGCDSTVASFGFNPQNSRLWMDDLIDVDGHRYKYKTCEEIGCPPAE